MDGTTRDVRTLFLDAANTSRRLLASPQALRQWEAPSALRQFSVRGLAGHLARAIVNVCAYLEQPEPAHEAPIAGADYYVALNLPAEIGAAENVQIRRRGEEAASGGHQKLIETVDGAISTLGKELAEQPASRKMRVAGDLVMLLDDYLLTRVVEMTVHSDDLALSVGLDPPDFDAQVMDVAIAYLVDVARRRHGDLAVLRALSRRERDDVDALRVF